MLTINLERALLRSNKKVLTPKALLHVREYDKLGNAVEDTTLQRLGLARSAVLGKEIRQRVDDLKEQANRFNQKRVFHVSQIEAICNRYYLRFLPTQHYKGSIPAELSSRITNFEAAYGITCKADQLCIVAPLRSFDLERRPKDPLLFYRINEQYYYLIHKWGNDLSVLRRILPFLSTPLSVWLPIVVAAFGLALVIGRWIGFMEPPLIVCCVITGLFSVIFWIVCLVIYKDDGDWEFGPKWMPMNDWKSSYV